MKRAIKVILDTATVGQSFATCGVVRSIATGRTLASGKDRPYGFTGAAMDDARAIATGRGYEIVSAEAVRS